MNSSFSSRTALVLAGGGTRGAYEVGVIHYLRTMLPPAIARRFHFQVHCGSSVGAINSAFMTASAHNLEYQGNELLRLWRSIESQHIYRRGPVSFGKFLFRTVLGVGMHVFNIRGFKTPEDQALHFQGFFDTQPFLTLLLEGCRWQNITKNIESGLVDALTVSATNMFTGDIELFVQKNQALPYSDRIPTRLVKIGPRHVMASAAIPILFPPVPIHGTYYNDGGMRMNTPLAPAVSLGASRILVVGTRYIRPKEKMVEADTHAKISPSLRPGLGDVLGKVLNSILLDRVEADRDQLFRINRILDICKKHTTPEVYKTISAEAKIQRIETLSIFPSVDIHTLVDETVAGSYKKLKTFGAFERFVLRILEADSNRGRDLLSYFLFEPTYVQKLIDLGFEDARTKHDQLCEFAEHAIERKALD